MLEDRTLMLDFDGTLCDSLPALRDAYVRFLAGEGVDADGTDFDRVNGPPLEDVVADLKGRYCLAGDADEMLRRYADLAAEAHREARPAEGAAEVLALAAGRSWRSVVVTSARSATVGDWLARHGLAAFITGVVGGDMVVRGKPDPEPYREALRLAGSHPEAAVAVEDSRQGVAAALGAGIATWMIAPAAPREFKSHSAFRGTLPDFASLIHVL